jgi:glyoxylase-like metal-dependent hydrolase (beta-lactamase superfamily II)
MHIIQLTVGPIQTNCYIVSDGETAVCIDPGWDAELILSKIRENNLELRYIFLTHGHFDHILAAAKVKNETGARVVIHAKDAGMLENSENSLAGMARVEQEQIKADIAAGDGDIFSSGKLSFKYLHTPGHTPGSSVILCEDAMFSGDTLFSTDCGRCDLPGGDYSEMQRSLRRLYELDGDYAVYPGHDESTTLDTERRVNGDMLRAVGK